MSEDLDMLFKTKLKELLVLGAEVLAETKHSDDINPTTDHRGLYVHTVGEHGSTIKVTKQ